MVWELVEEDKPTAGETHLLKSRRQKGKWGRMLRNIDFTNDILCLGRKRNHTSIKCTHWNFRKKAHFLESFLATKPILSLQAIMLFELSPSWRRLKENEMKFTYIKEALPLWFTLIFSCFSRNETSLPTPWFSLSLSLSLSFSRCFPILFS